MTCTLLTASMEPMTCTLLTASMEPMTCTLLTASMDHRKEFYTSVVPSSSHAQEFECSTVSCTDVLPSLALPAADPTSYGV